MERVDTTATSRGTFDKGLNNGIIHRTELLLAPPPYFACITQRSKKGRHLLFPSWFMRTKTLSRARPMRQSRIVFRQTRGRFICSCWFFRRHNSRKCQFAAVVKSSTIRFELLGWAGTAICCVTQGVTDVFHRVKAVYRRPMSEQDVRFMTKKYKALTSDLRPSTSGLKVSFHLKSSSLGYWICVYSISKCILKVSWAFALWDEFLFTVNASASAS